MTKHESKKHAHESKDEAPAKAKSSHERPHALAHTEGPGESGNPVLKDDEKRDPLEDKSEGANPPAVIVGGEPAAREAAVHAETAVEQKEAIEANPPADDNTRVIHPGKTIRQRIANG